MNKRIEKIIEEIINLDYREYENVEIETLLGKIFKEIIVGVNYISFINESEVYIMIHFQDCCESVEIEDIVGDISDIINYEITMAEESTNKENESDYGSFTWTYYKIGTCKGDISIRWYGESNGYYSEDVSLVKLLDY